MRWLLAGLLFVSVQSFAIPDEILTSYLERHEVCVKDASLRAPDREAFNKLKEQCRLDYLRMVDGGHYSEQVLNDDSAPVRKWTKFITATKKLPEFEIESKRNYLFKINRAKLGNFYITRDKNYPERFILWKDGRLASEYYSVPMSDTLYNARYVNGRIAVIGLDSDIVYYAVHQGDAYRMETEYGHVLKLNAALFLANNALIVYNDVPIGTISRNVAKEID